ncbi:Small glutamine-rich tetratricopeptide repeat-containing protein 2 [Dispira simplex]|nr:Small glutamine-rich tetratricopeptide repeat-containing protein 2 [Dispira simplex]
MDNSQRKLVFAILEFLQQSVATDQVPASSTEGLEIAVDCIGEAFGVDINDDQQRSELSIAPATLPQVFDVYLKTQEKMATAKKTTLASASSASSGEPSTSVNAGTSDQDKTRANELKTAGNKALAAKEYDEAIRLYGEAIALDARNPIYFANRAAAYSQRGDYSEAVDDANRALEIDSRYSKAYSRLAHAYFGLKQYDLAVKAYDKGLELDPTNANMKSAREVAQQRLADTEAASSDQVADTGSSGPGGMDLNALLNNPGLMNMASQMMSNGGLANLMNNPAMRQMAESMMGSSQGGSGGNSSDPLASLMGNPQLQQMAQQFTGGASGRNDGSSDAAPSGNGGGNPLAGLASNPQLRQLAEQFMRNQGGSNSGR